MFKVGNVGRSITAAGSIFLSALGCGGESRAARFAQEKAARLADEAGLRQAASGLLHRCHKGKNLAIQADVDSFSKCVEEGTKAAYPASCRQYYDKQRVRTSMGTMYPSECELKYQTFVTTGEDHFIRSAQSE